VRFQTPGGQDFEIPDEWWQFVELDNWSRVGDFYPYDWRRSDIEVVDAKDIEPPLREVNVQLFKKYKMVPVLFALTSPECCLPPVEVTTAPGLKQYRYAVYNGYHRYYASIAVRYPMLPVKIVQPFIPEAA
jgi:hypothetical protein